MIALVCGGRSYWNTERVWLTLDALRASYGIMGIIHGAAPGADTLAMRWASSRGVPQLAFAADWSQGRKAGPERNARMLREGKPGLVIAFPGGRGTENMVRQAEAAGVRVIRVED